MINTLIRRYRINRLISEAYKSYAEVATYPGRGERPSPVDVAGCHLCGKQWVLDEGTATANRIEFGSRAALHYMYGNCRGRRY